MRARNRWLGVAIVALTAAAIAGTVVAAGWIRDVAFEDEAELLARLSDAQLAEIVEWSRSVGLAAPAGTRWNVADLPAGLRRSGAQWARSSVERGQRYVYLQLSGPGGVCGMLVASPTAPMPSPGPKTWSRWAPGVWYNAD